MDLRYEISKIKCRIGCLIMIIVFIAFSLILEIIQLSLDDGYSYNGILELLELNKNLTSTNFNECNTYISNINDKNEFSHIKTLFGIIIDINIILYIIYRIIAFYIKPIDCKIGALFTLFLLFGKISSFILACIAGINYSMTNYTSNDFESCNKMNGKFQISKSDFNQYISSFSVFDFISPILNLIFFFGLAIVEPYYLCFILFKDCDSEYCINEENLWFCKCICDIFMLIIKFCKCFCDCIDCCECCDECGKCSHDCINSCKCYGENGRCCWDCIDCCECCDGCGTCCCKEDYIKLQQKIRKYKQRIKDLEDENNYLRNKKEEKREIELQANIIENNIDEEKNNYKQYFLEKEKELNDENYYLKEENNRLQSENNKLKSKNNKYKQQVKDLKIELQYIQNDIFSNSKKIQILEEENEQLKQENIILTNDNKNIDKLQNEINNLKNLLSIFEKKIKNLKNENISLNIEQKQYKVIMYYIKQMKDKKND